jgi:hypothetical protein
MSHGDVIKLVSLHLPAIYAKVQGAIFVGPQVAV